jgi:hypothetical protein
MTAVTVKPVISASTTAAASTPLDRIVVVLRTECVLLLFSSPLTFPILLLI